MKALPTEFMSQCKKNKKNLKSAELQKSNMEIKLQKKSLPSDILTAFQSTWNEDGVDKTLAFFGTCYYFCCL